jgi:hypothetical protein
MGADLYIKKTDEKTRRGGFEVSEKAVDSGYFRDCYNGRGLFSVISANVPNVELSWWQTKDRKELFCKGSNEMSIAGIKKLLAELKPIVEKFKKLNCLYYSEYNVKTRKHYKGKKMEDTQFLFYHDWADLLIRFLELAIEKKSCIIWSV